MLALIAAASAPAELVVSAESVAVELVAVATELVVAAAELVK